MKRKFKGGMTSLSLPVIVYDNTSTTGAGLSGLTSSTSGLVLEYRRAGSSSWTSVTLVSKTLGTYTSGGIVASGSRAGRYEIDIPDAAIAAGVRMVEVCLRGAANMHPVDIEIELDAVDYQDNVRFGLTAIPNVAQGSSGALPTGNSSGQVTVATLTAGAIQSVWDALTSGLSTVGSIGKWILDNLNATVSSRATQTSVDAIPTNPLLTNDSRLNNLDFSIAAVSTAIGNLNNLSALINLYGSPLMEIPDSGSTVYTFTIVVRDNEGKLVNLDASPTLAASNAAGTSRSANLSAVSNPSTGRYTFTYSVANTHAKESLRITASGTVSTEARYVEWVGAVVDYDTLTTLQAVQTTVNGIDSRLPASPAAVSDIPTANQNRDAVWNALMANYTTANTFGHHVIRSLNSNNTVQITGGGSYHIFSVIHDSEPNSIHEDAFDDDALSARVLASSAATEIATAVGNLQMLTRLDSMIESDGAGQFRFDSIAVSLAGSGGVTDWTTDEKTAIRTILGFNSSGTIVSLSSGALFNITTQTANLFKYGDAQRWNSPANQIDVTITKVP